MRFVRSLVRRWLKQYNYDVRRYVTERGASISLLALAVNSHIRVKRNFFFLQVGANDGVIDDPIHYLVKRHHLRGLLLEPMPEAFKQLQANYADQPQIQFENCALWSENGERLFFRIRTDVYQDPLVRGMAGFSRDKLLATSRFLPGLAKNIEELVVRTETIGSVLEKHAVAQVDLLLVDTEGFDDQIIYFVLASGLAPAIIYYEHIHLSADQQDACCEFLSRKGYRFARTRTNTLALIEENDQDESDGSHLHSQSRRISP